MLQKGDRDFDRHYGASTFRGAICHLRVYREGWTEEPEITGAKASDIARQRQVA